MANEENLKKGKKTQFRSGEEAEKNGKKGGVASGKSRRRKKCLRETAEMLLSLPMKDGKLDKLDSFSTISEKNVTVEEKMIIKQIQKAFKGNLGAFEAVIALVSEKNEANGENASGDSTKAFIEALNGAAAEVWNDEKPTADDSV